ncbi:MAG TPA: YciI family protein [Terriglobales bacterium]|nr:YciI family protein [Terriglobales bacterium]
MAKFVIFFKPGPAWIRGKSIFEQPLDEHVRYLTKVYKSGKLVMAGPFHDSSGGMTILEVVDEAEARQIALEDPVVQSGILTAEWKSWRPLPWEEYARR